MYRNSCHETSCQGSAVYNLGRCNGGDIRAPTSAGARASDVDQPPIERLSSIRNAYLSTLKSDQLKAEAPSGEDQTAQFRNFPNFPNFSNWRNR